MTELPLPAPALDKIRRTRRHPRPTQSDYLVLRCLRDNLAEALREVSHPVDHVLDLYCGTQPYRDLLPPHSHYTSMDITTRYGIPDVISDEFLPFPDASFDLVLFTEAFHYVKDPTHGVGELLRVLRPDGTLVLTVPLVWEYDRRTLERRYTGPGLLELFAGWHEPRLIENGGYAVSWATLTGRLLRAMHEMAPEGARGRLEPALRGAFYVMNGAAALLARGEARWRPTDPFVLPMGLMLVARAPRSES